MSSLVKYYQDRGPENGNGRGQYWWGRADRDGLPFRGRAVPNYTEEEFEEKLVRTGDAKVNLFDVTEDGDQRQAYLTVVDRVANGWYVCLHREHHFVDGRMLVYIEWFERFVEDRNPNEHDATHSYVQQHSQQPGDSGRRSIVQVRD